MNILNSLNSDQKELLRIYLEGFLTSKRLSKLQQTLQKRTRSLTLVLENVYQSHNAAAALRSAECFGVQDVHIIEDTNTFEDSNTTVSKGARKWLTLPSWSDQGTQKCFQHLKTKGYKIVATSLERDAKPLNELDTSMPIALVIGGEMGLSKEALSLADETVHIPMQGFTESLNLSVTAALGIYALKEKMQTSGSLLPIPAQASQALYLEWLTKSIKSFDKHFDLFCEIHSIEKTHT